jgi:hypothetical protein
MREIGNFLWAFYASGSRSAADHVFNPRQPRGIIRSRVVGQFALAFQSIAAAMNVNW